jgi:hypothetical protein
LGLVELIRERVDPRPRFSAEQMKRARPMRNPNVKWEIGTGGELLLEAPLAEQGRGFSAWMARRMNMPVTKKFELEPVGAFLWELFDGQHSFETLSKKLREEYRMNRLEADASLGAFLQMLSQRKLIVMTLPTGSKK